MNLLITAISSATGPSGICRHAYNLARCAAGREEASQITLALGKWQGMYFRNLFVLKTIRANIISVDVFNDAYARNIWYLRELPKMVDEVAAHIVHLSFSVPICRNALRF